MKYDEQMTRATIIDRGPQLSHVVPAQAGTQAPTSLCSSFQHFLGVAPIL